MRLIRCASLAALCLALGVATADDKMPSEQEMMAAMMKHSTPGPEHKVFDHFAGNWTYTAKFWLDPSQPPEEGGGKSESKVMMDGRFFAETIKSNGKPMPFEGKGWWGYDNAKKKYWFAWIDTMTTSLSTGEGVWDEKNKTMTWSSMMFDPGLGKECKFKEVSIVKPDGSINRTFYKVENGKDIKNMEFTFTRAK